MCMCIKMYQPQGQYEILKSWQAMLFFLHYYFTLVHFFGSSLEFKMQRAQNSFPTKTPIIPVRHTSTPLNNIAFPIIAHQISFLFIMCFGHSFRSQCFANVVLHSWTMKRGCGRNSFLDDSELSARIMKLGFLSSSVGP